MEIENEISLLRQRVCEESFAQIQKIFATHFSIMVFFTLLKGLGYQGILPIAFVSFVNSVCLAERCWAIQRRSMDCWSLRMQTVFVLMRLAVVVGTAVVVWVAAHRLS